MSDHQDHAKQMPDSGRLSAPRHPCLSKDARAELEEFCVAIEAMTATKDRRLATALRLLLNWHDEAA